MKNLYLISIFLIAINALNAQNLTKGFKLINKGKTIEAKEFFLENKNFCLSKAGLLKLAIVNNELSTLKELNQAYNMVNEFKVCYNTLSKKEINKHIKYITNHDTQDIYNTIEEKYYSFSIKDNKETTFLAYLNNYPIGKYTTQANEAIAFLKAKEINSKESFNNYLDNYPSGEHKNETLALIAKIYFDETKYINAEKEFQEHLSVYPNKYYKAEVFALIEKFYFENAKSINSEIVFLKYLSFYPNGYYKAEVLTLIEWLYWEKSVNANTVKSYLVYLNKYPKGVYSEYALSKIETIKGKAIPKVNFPRTVRASDTRSRDGIYEWETEFQELGGYVGYHVTAVEFYIQAPDGTRYSNSWSSSFDVNPGSSVKTDYWCDKSDKWDGGFFHCIWRGVDQKGNAIELLQEVRLAK
jgi:hypothetical protein